MPFVLKKSPIFDSIRFFSASHLLAKFKYSLVNSSIVDLFDLPSFVSIGDIDFKLSKSAVILFCKSPNLKLKNVLTSTKTLNIFSCKDDDIFAKFNAVTSWITETKLSSSRRLFEINAKINNMMHRIENPIE